MIYHYEEDGGWWAETPEYPTFAAFGSSRDEVTLLVQEGLPLTAGADLALVGLEPLSAATAGQPPRSLRLAVPSGLIPRYVPPLGQPVTG